MFGVCLLLPREVTAEYMVQFYTASEREKAIDDAYAYHHPRLYAFAGNGRGEALSGSGLTVDGDVTVTCVKMNERGENIVRFFNPYTEAKTVKFSREVALTNMRETENGEKVTEMVVSPKKIITVKF